MTAAYSRLLWCRFGVRQDMRTLLSGLEEAFLAFGGVPRELLFDQMRGCSPGTSVCTAARSCTISSSYASHTTGASLRACRPYRAQTKGTVERPVRYLRENLVYGRAFLNDADRAQQCADWLARVANARRNATTQERPSERFARDERALLQPLAARRYVSLGLDAPAVTRPPARPTPPIITVETRPLAAYARLAGGAA